MVLGIFQHWEIIVIVLVALLLFGSQLPKIARSAGKSIVEFKKGVKDVKEEIKAESEPKSMPEATAKREIPAEKIESEEKVSSES